MWEKKNRLNFFHSSYLATDWASEYRPSRAKHSAFSILNLWQAGADSKARSMQNTTLRDQQNSQNSLLSDILDEKSDLIPPLRVAYHPEVSLLKSDLCHSLVLQDRFCILQLPKEFVVFRDNVQDYWPHFSAMLSASQTRPV